MAGKRSKKKTKGTPVRIKLLAGVLIAILVLGVGGVKYFQSTRGMVFLLDRGLTGYYAIVQQDIQESLRGAFEKLGLTGNIKSKRRHLPHKKSDLYYIECQVSCGEACDFIKVNLALTKAVRRLGAIVRRSSEEDEGEKLLFEVGSRRFLTQRIVILKSGSLAGGGQVGGSGTGTSLPRLAIVVDDFGYSRNGTMRAFFELDLPLTISVIPSLVHSNYSVTKAIENGKEAILHLPMEPEQEYETDVLPVMTSMTRREIRDLVTRYVAELPGIRGVNNHMGSKATQDERVMKTVLKVLRKRRLFFLDSLTSPRSIAYNTARGMGVRAARNDLFLDADTEDPVLVEERLHRVIALAKEKGTAVCIAHPRRWTLEVFENNMEMLKNSGVRVVFLSELVKASEQD